LLNTAIGQFVKPMCQLKGDRIIYSIERHRNGELFVDIILDAAM